MNPEQFIPHESDGEYERLQHMGSFELSIGHGYLINEVRYAGGGYDSSMSGPLEGIAKCSLVFKLAPDSLSSSLLYNGQEQSLARYLFFFFQ
ncbi:MAG TPA: hypothetical protein VEF04_13350, partial [Blastocatellia bacterium]|nr:hypothetical protein [Blastocatellia bacterium]